MHASLFQHGVHAGDSSAPQDGVVCHFVLRCDVQDTSDAAHMKGVELSLLLSMRGPGHGAVQESVEDTDLSCVGLLFVLCQCVHCGSRLEDALV